MLKEACSTSKGEPLKELTEAGQASTVASRPPPAPPPSPQQRYRVMLAQQRVRRLPT
jgi:hypothetical protein